VERQIRSNRLPANVLVCEEGYEVWTDFEAWQKTKISVMLHGKSPWLLTALCVIGIVYFNTQNGLALRSDDSTPQLA
jgi:hypothetical protein